MSSNKGLSASERINALLDDSSFVELGAYVTARSTDFNMDQKDTPKDGVITGYGLIDGRLVYVYSQDVSVLGGAIGEMHAKKIAKLYDMAVKMGAPIIGLIDSAGLRLQEASDALNAFGRLYMKQTMASGVIPQITAVLGTCGGGTAIIPSLTDFTFMTKENAKLFVNSPNALAGNYTEKLDTASAEYLFNNTTLVDNVYENEAELFENLRSFLSYLPSNNQEEAYAEPEDDANRTIPGIEGFKDDSRAVIQNIADDEKFFEIKRGIAPEIVTGFIRMNGATVGVLGNQIKDGSDKLSASGARMASKFVNFCDAFNIPVLTLTNIKGFKATIEEEKSMANAAASLTAAFANASVPLVNVITGDAFGSAYTVMNSKALGADMVYAWPAARIGMMDPEMAVKIMYEEEVKDSASLKEKVKEYTDLQASALSAARRGYIDDIIEPDATRKRVIAAFEMLASKFEERPAKKHTAL